MTSFCQFVDHWQGHARNRMRAQPGRALKFGPREKFMVTAVAAAVVATGTAC